MGKTALTKRIENRLSTYRPKELGDYKLNYMRDQYDMYEVPVTHGAIKDGLIDYVWLAEGFRNTRKEYTCRAPYYAKNNWFSADVDCGYTIDDFINMSEEPTITDTICNRCRYRTYTVLQDDTPAVICFEIKISKTDFHSPHGHNFVGNLNYYVMPLELYKEVKNEIPDEIGCIVFSASDNQDILRKRKDAIWYDIDSALYTSMLLTAMNKYRKKWSENMHEQRNKNDKYYNTIDSLLKENMLLKREISEKPACFVAVEISEYQMKYPQFFMSEITKCANANSNTAECTACIFSNSYITKCKLDLGI